ncbi:Techylectin-5B [Amphibalanus amphitrite]|uniref:Techylectin-5B n=1 Tax=Amphibalanus amphitrite TaxID=1232801 RepID=A0A6A4WTU4_AMPAM|nr:Techylectin-5B [Amphibalanus amphitrite]
MSPLLPAVVAALLTVAPLPAQCSVQQQQQQQQVAAGLYITPDELWQLVDRAVTAAIQPLTIKLDSRIDTLDSRLDVLDARLDRVLEQERKQDSEIATSGIYLLRPGLGAAGEVPAYCDLETDGGRWTVIQRRADIEPREDFYRNWTAYREGFGELDSEFWWINQCYSDQDCHQRGHHCCRAPCNNQCHRLG